MAKTLRNEYPVPTLVHFAREHLEALENWAEEAHDDEEMKEEYQSRIESLTAALDAIGD